MARIELRPATEDDVQALCAQGINYDDATEIEGLGLDCAWALGHSLATSLEAYTVVADGQVATMFGIADSSPLGRDPAPWMISTNAVLRHKKEVLILSTIVTYEWRKKYGDMTNYVDARHKRAVRWLRHLGADMVLEPRFGPHKRPYYRFTFGAIKYGH